MCSHKGEKGRKHKRENEREREKKNQEREKKNRRKEKKKGNAYHILLMYTHPLFKKCLRLSPPQASLGNSECALFKERKKENQAGCLDLSGPGGSLRRSQVKSS